MVVVVNWVCKVVRSFWEVARSVRRVARVAWRVWRSAEEFD